MSAGFPHRHPTDPPGMHERAEDLGRLCGLGEIGIESLSGVCADWADGNRGLQCRLNWTARDAAHAVKVGRAAAERRIWWAVTPLFKRPGPVDAAAVNEAAIAAAGGLLEWDEIVPVIRAARQRVLRARAR